MAKKALQNYESDCHEVVVCTYAIAAFGCSFSSPQDEESITCITYLVLKILSYRVGIKMYRCTFQDK